MNDGMIEFGGERFALEDIQTVSGPVRSKEEDLKGYFIWITTLTATYQEFIHATDKLLQAEDNVVARLKEIHALVRGVTVLEPDSALKGYLTNDDGTIVPVYAVETIRDVVNPMETPVVALRLKGGRVFPLQYDYDGEVLTDADGPRKFKMIREWLGVLKAELEAARGPKVTRH